MEVWIRLYREAEDQMVAEAGLKTRNALRRMTRSKDEKIVVRASDILNKVREAQRMREDKMLQDAPAQFDADIAVMCNFMRGLTEEEAEQEMDRCMEMWERRKKERASAGG